MALRLHDGGLSVTLADFLASFSLSDILALASLVVALVVLVYTTSLLVIHIHFRRRKLSRHSKRRRHVAR